MSPCRRVAGTLGLLTGIPVLRSGPAAPFPSLLIARTGVHRAVAATGLLVIGAVDDASNGWTAPLLVILRAVALMAVAGTPAAGGRSAAAEERVPAPVAAGRSARG